MSETSMDPVRAVYELREAAVEHGKALANADLASTPETRDELLATRMTLEEKTVAALDECSDNAEEAAAEARAED
jgi:3-oxoacyl-[acyl-carrier-protein] synthase III